VLGEKGPNESISRCEFIEVCVKTEVSYLHHKILFFISLTFSELNLREELLEGISYMKLQIAYSYSAAGYSGSS
jgi:hypothetical protein